VILKGRCRSCKKRIDILYPLLEIFCSAVFVLIYLKFGLIWPDLILLGAASTLIVAAISDINEQEVDLWLLVAGNVLAIAWYLSLGIDLGRFQLLLAAIAISASLPLLFALVSRQRWMGYGDVLFAVSLGALCGYPAAITGLFFAFLAGSLYGIIKVSFGSAKLKSRLAFGPFLALGGFLGLFYGQQIFDLYLKLLGL
jgi:prepilin signal peptidase PulO-like enzyme (type II secretory pathway)